MRSSTLSPAKKPLLPASVGEIEREPASKSNAALPKIKLLALFAGSLAAAALLFVGFNARYSSKDGNRAPIEAKESRSGNYIVDLAKCSGHGTLDINSECACDLGFVGAKCDQVASWRQPSSARAPNALGERQAIAMVIDAYTPQGSLDSEKNVRLARSFARSGAGDVTIFTADQSASAALRDEVAAGNIRIVQLDHACAKGGCKSAAAIRAAAHSTFAKLMSEAEKTKFDLVYFDANSGAAEPYLAARQLGANCFPAQVLVGVTRPQFEADASTPNKVPEEAVLMHTELRNAALTMADQVVFFDSDLRDREVNQPGRVRGQQVSSWQVLPRVPSGDYFGKSAGAPSSSRTKPKELVIFGGLDQATLPAICDSLDAIHQIAPTPMAKDGSDALHVTFMKAADADKNMVNGQTALEYIAARAESWPRLSVSVHAAPQNGVASMVKYMSAPDSGRVAVMAGDWASSNQANELAEDLALAHVPLILPADSVRSLLPKTDLAEGELVQYSSNKEGEKLNDALAAAVIQGLNKPVGLARHLAKRATQAADFVSTVARQSRDVSPACTTSTLPKLSAIVVLDDSTELDSLKQLVASYEQQLTEYPKLEVILVAPASLGSETDVYLADLQERWAALGWAVIDSTANAQVERVKEALPLATGTVIAVLPSSIIPKPHFARSIARGAAASRDAADKGFSLAAGVDLVENGKRLATASPIDSLILPLVAGNGAARFDGIFAFDAAHKHNIMDSLTTLHGTSQVFAARAAGLRIATLPESLGWRIKSVGRGQDQDAFVSAHHQALSKAWGMLRPHEQSGAMRLLYRRAIGSVANGEDWELGEEADIAGFDITSLAYSETASTTASADLTTAEEVATATSTDAESSSTASEEATATSTDAESSSTTSEEATATSTDAESSSTASEEATATSTDADSSSTASEETTATSTDVDSSSTVSEEATATSTDAESSSTTSEEATATSTDAESSSTNSEEATATSTDATSSSTAQVVSSTTTSSDQTTSTSSSTAVASSSSVSTSTETSTVSSTTVSSVSSSSSSSSTQASSSTQSQGTTTSRSTATVGASMTIPAAQATEVITAPIIRADYPASVMACDTRRIAIDLSGTQAKDPTFFITYAGSNSAITTDISTRFSSGTKSQRIDFPASFVTAGTPLVLSIRAYERYQDFTTQYESQAVTITISQTTDATPTVSQNELYQRIRPRDGVQAQLKMQFPACSTSSLSAVFSQFTFVWTLTSPSGQAVDLTQAAFNTAGRTTPMISFNTAQLTYGVYVLTGTATRNSVSYSSTSTVEIVPSDLQAAIDGGNYQVRSASVASTLKATIKDPDNPNLSSTPNRYAFTFLKCTSGFASCVNLQDSNADTLAIPASGSEALVADADSYYAVIVTDTTYPSRTAVDFAQIRGAAGVVPRLIAGRFPSARIVSRDSSIRLWVSAVTADTGAPVSVTSYLWSVSPRSVTSVTLSGIRTMSSYAFPRNTLPAGADVTLQCTVTANGASTSVDVRFQVASQLSGGTVSLFNEVAQTSGGAGQATIDTFTISSAGATGGVAPYAYSFGFASGSGSAAQDTFITYQAPASSVASVSFPMGATKAFVIVSDSVGSEARVEASLTITRPTGQTVATVITAAQSMLSNIQDLMLASPDQAITAISALLNFIAIDSLPTTPSATERTQILTMQSQANGYLKTITLSAVKVDAGFAARSASALVNMDVSAADDSTVSDTLALLDKIIAGAKTAKDGTTVSANPRVTATAANVLDKLLSAFFARSSTTLLRKRSALFKRQLSQEQTLRNQVSSVLSGTIAGDSCQVTGDSVMVIPGSSSFIGNARRVVADGTATGDSTRTVGNMDVTLPADMIAGCYDTQIVQWRQARNSQVAANRILSQVLSVNVFDSGSSTPLDVSTLSLQYTANSVADAGTGYEPKCVSWSGADWSTTGCTTTVLTSTSVSCTCNMNSEFAVQGRAIVTDPAPSDPPAPPADPSTVSTGAIAGAVVGSMFGVGIIAGGVFYHQRRKRRLHATAPSPDNE